MSESKTAGRKIKELNCPFCENKTCKIENASDYIEISSPCKEILELIEPHRLSNVYHVFLYEEEWDGPEIIVRL